MIALLLTLATLIGALYLAHRNAKRKRARGYELDSSSLLSCLRGRR